MICPVSSTTPTRPKKRKPSPLETDEGLASPYGRGAPERGGEGVFYPLSHFVTAPPKWEPRGERIATSAAGLLAMTCVIRRLPEYPGDCHTSDIGRLLAKTRVNCRFSCRGGHWPPAFLRRFPKKMGGHWPPLLALSVILILIPAQIQKRLAVRKQTASLFVQFSKASYFHRPSGYLPASVMAFRALTTMGLSAA